MPEHDRTLVLFEGTEPTDDPTDEWLPRLEIQQNGTWELHVIVGEEAEGMAEGVTPELFDAMMAEVGIAVRLFHFLRKQGEVGVSMAISHAEGDLGWSVSSLFGEEEPGSPMAGGAIYGTGESIYEALDQALKDARA